MAPSRGYVQRLGKSTITLQNPKTSYRFTFYRLASTLTKLPIFEAIANHDPDSTAVIHPTSRHRFTYGSLLRDTVKAKERLQKLSPPGHRLEGQRIAFLVEDGYDYVGAPISSNVFHVGVRHVPTNFQLRYYLYSTLML